MPLSAVLVASLWNPTTCIAAIASKRKQSKGSPCSAVPLVLELLSLSLGSRFRQYFPWQRITQADYSLWKSKEILEAIFCLNCSQSKGTIFQPSSYFLLNAMQTQSAELILLLSCKHLVRWSFTHKQAWRLPPASAFNLATKSLQVRKNERR